MDYASALDYIHSRNKFGIKLGLDNISALLASMGCLQDDLRFIHIAGTNGKGSTSSMLSHALCACGYKTGLFISPYVVCFNERIQINNEYIPDARLAEITHSLSKQIEFNTQQGIAPPSEFELITAIAIQYFYEEGADVIVWETGMGGRLDATNVISTNLLSIITSISHDHKEHLGHDLAQIAYEKACIIKPERPCVLMHQSALVENVICKKALELNSEVYIADEEDLRLIESSYTYQSVLYDQKHLIRLPLAGQYQLRNLACVMKALELLHAQGIYIQFKVAIEGIEKMQFPGRFEILYRNPLVIIDAAHNEEGVQMLNENIRSFFEGVDVTLFVGKLRDKDFSDSFAELLQNKQTIYTLTPPNERAMSAEELTQFISEHYHIATTPIAVDSICQYIANNPKNKTVYIIAGSIYLISSVRASLLSEKCARSMPKGTLTR